METQDDKDPLYEKAKLIARSTDNLCVANIQRTLLIGYNRANRLMESMIEDGIVEKYETIYGVYVYKLAPSNAGGNATERRTGGGENGNRYCRERSR